MPQSLFYKFDGFVLNVIDRTLSHDDQPIPLTPTPFKLLLALVEREGQIVKRSELIRIVWGNPNDREAENKFNVTLSAVRRALKDPKKPRQFIVKKGDGYKFDAPTDRIPPLSDAVFPEQEDRPNEIAALKDRSAATSILDLGWRRHALHIFISCGLYAALYAVTVTLEVAFEFDRLGSSALRVLPLTFGWVMITSATGLIAIQKLVFQNRKGGIGIAVLIFFMAALVLFLGLTILPDYPITRANFQTYPAQAAYLKDIVYFLVLALLFLIIPFHFVSTMRREIEEGRPRDVLDTLVVKRLAILPRGAIYLRFGHLALLLLMFAVLSIAMAAHLLDNLQPGTYRNLFTQLFYLRGILYFGLGTECLAWYYGALNDLKRESLSRSKA